MFHLVFALTLLVPSAAPPTSIAPFDVHASGFLDLRGIAVDGEGNVLVADRDAGTVSRIARDGSRIVVAHGLEAPVGLVVDAGGRLMIAEERAGRVARIESDGSRTAVVSGVKQPRWLALGEDGTLYVSARRLTRGTDPEPDDESAEPEVILSLAAGGPLRVFADGFKKLQGLAVTDGAVFVATQGRRDEARVDGVVFRIPVLADGSAGVATQVGPGDQLKKPVGLAVDRLGALYVTTRELSLSEDRARRAIAKLHADGRVSLFADGLDRPHGIAFDADGALYLADGSGGRVLRFLPPAAPIVHVADFTAEATIGVVGATAPGARVDVFVGDAGSSFAGLADATGAFTVTVELTAEAANDLEVFAAARGGDGLASPPGRATVTHDATAPTVLLQAPGAGTHVRQVVRVVTRASDTGSGVAGLSLTIDGRVIPGTLSPAPPGAALTADAGWDSRTAGDGSHTLAAAATDRAGNVGTASRVLIVDNSAPDTSITDGPDGAIQATTATFGFTGSDNLTSAPGLAFAWRLDGGSWSAFSPATSATLVGLGQGLHRFEVKARDLAGNEDPTPASRAFTVGGIRVAIAEPVDGATVTAGLVIVRGTIDADGQDVGVSVNGATAAVVAGTFAAMVPVSPITTALTATAAASGGGVAEHGIAISVSPGSIPPPILAANPESGVAPLSVAFSVLGASVASISLDHDGDGRVDFEGTTLDGQTFTYAQPGVYFPAATVVDTAGNQVTVRTVIQAHDRAALDSLLRGKWSAMREALARRDVEAAVRLFAESGQAQYRAMFTALTPTITQIADAMQDIELIYAIDGEAKYRIRRQQLYGGQPMTFSYYVYFVQDGAGLWVIDSF